jgi:formyl-CoA transferase
MWAKLCGLLGLDDLVEHPDFATWEARFEHRADVNAAIAAITADKTCTEWIDLLNEAGIPCGPIYSLDETFDDPQVRHLGVAQTVNTPSRGEIEVVGQPIHLTRTPTRIAAPAPEYGEHTDEVLTGLGYSANDVEGLHKRGVV